MIDQEIVDYERSLDLEKDIAYIEKEIESYEESIKELTELLANKRAELQKLTKSFISTNIVPSNNLIP